MKGTTAAVNARELSGAKLVEVRVGRVKSLASVRVVLTLVGGQTVVLSHKQLGRAIPVAPGTGHRATLFRELTAIRMQMEEVAVADPAFVARVKSAAGEKSRRWARARLKQIRESMNVIAIPLAKSGLDREEVLKILGDPGRYFDEAVTQLVHES